VITAPAYQDKKIGVFGLARTGIAAAEALTASGARVYAWDDAAAKRLPVQAVAEDLYALDFDTLDALLLAPGVPLTHPEPHMLVKKAQAAGVPLISDIDVFEAAREALPKHHTVAITGTNGKSTTTALIGHIIEACGRPAAVGGNIGTGVLALSALKKGGVYIFELSSFQIDLTQHFNADVAVLLNVTPDHLDRHGTFENYLAAKTRLFEMQKGKAPVAVIGVDDEHGEDLAEKLSSDVVKVSVVTPLDQGVYVQEAILFDAMENEAIEVGDLRQAICLQGEHNWQNAAAAYAVCRKLGLKTKKIFKAMLSFPGLVHRQEIVTEIKGVRYVNDSKATNSDAALRALKSFKNIHWVAGGRAKEKSFTHLASAVSDVKQAYFMGDAAEQLASDLGDKVRHKLYKTMLEALDAAAQNAVEGDVILLSPACTAFDQFTDFEKRGEAFRAYAFAQQGNAS